MYQVFQVHLASNIPNFSVVRNIPHDIMHDVLEGVIPYEMKLLLEYLVDKKYIATDTLNHLTLKRLTSHQIWMKKFIKKEAVCFKNVAVSSVSPLI